jgi:hypothetical protein
MRADVSCAKSGLGEPTPTDPGTIATETTAAAAMVITKRTGAWSFCSDPFHLVDALGLSVEGVVLDVVAPANGVARAHRRHSAYSRKHPDTGSGALHW